MLLVMVEQCEKIVVDLKAGNQREWKLFSHG